MKIDYEKLIGRKHGKLTIESFAKRGKYTMLACRCECGNETIAAYSAIVGGHTQSCGCVRRANAGKMGAGNTKHGMHGTGIYRLWSGMKRRCYLESHPDYKNYGGRGITVCSAWRDSFETFLADMGPRPVGTSLDRIDNDAGYSKLNCRWATVHEQQNNKRYWTQPKQRKLKFSQAQEVRRLYIYGNTLASLAIKFEVSRATIKQIVDGETYLIRGEEAA